MMMIQTTQSRHKMMQDTRMPACPASSIVRQLARMTHSTVIRTAEGRTRQN